MFEYLICICVVSEYLEINGLVYVFCLVSVYSPQSLKKIEATLSQLGSDIVDIEIILDLKTKSTLKQQ